MNLFLGNISWAFFPHRPLKEYFAEETFKILSIRVTFNVPFRKKHSPVGRAIYFLIAKNTSNTLYLQLCIEYPINSGHIYIYSMSTVSFLKKKKHTIKKKKPTKSHI